MEADNILNAQGNVFSAALIGGVQMASEGLKGLMTFAGEAASNAGGLGSGSSRSSAERSQGGGGKSAPTPAAAPKVVDSSPAKERSMAEMLGGLTPPSSFALGNGSNNLQNEGKSSLGMYEVKGNALNGSSLGSFSPTNLMADFMSQRQASLAV